ncbi:unnamed protein product [Cyclocybe aegerita]|uniref:DUF6534 domain-containing protein n=1 Tax=Cyclocybe aegerita TaxID=1973307 RepID=A0A8S0X696_CYCAE|nr:unnamed protein product [Cyclocybe aegerita]
MPRRAAGGIWVAVQTKRHGDYTDPNITDYVFPPSYLWLISSAAADSLIAVSLAWSLYRRKTGFRATDAVITRIILFSVQTGIVTSVAALVSMITFVALPLTNTTTFVFNVLLMKLYGNFILATLNNRGVWQASLHPPEISILFPEPPKRINIDPSDSGVRARRATASGSPESKDAIALGPMKGLPV